MYKFINDYSRKLYLTTIVIQCLTLAVLVLHLFAAWQYKGRWIELSQRLDRVEVLVRQVNGEKAMPEQKQ